VLRYRVNANDAPLGYPTDVDRAVTDLASATGLRLTETSGHADISIGWSPSLYDPAPGTGGEAGVTRLQTVTNRSGTRFVAASITISSHLTPGNRAHAGEEPVLLHELGHAGGLGHFPGPEVMNPVDQGFLDYQYGELAGLNSAIQTDILSLTTDHPDLTNESRAVESG
jgi:hypothetical protein